MCRGCILTHSRRNKIAGGSSRPSQPRLGAAGQGYAWDLHHADGQATLVPHTPRLITDDMSVLRDAAIAGAGAAQLPTIFIADDIKAGRLVHVLPDWRPRSGIVHAVFPSRRGLLPSVRALIDFFFRECAIQRAQADKIIPRIVSDRPD